MRPMKQNVDLVVILLSAIAEFGTGDMSVLRHMLLAFTFGFWLNQEHG